jgi:hypothetical protein
MAAEGANAATFVGIAQRTFEDLIDCSIELIFSRFEFDAASAAIHRCLTL